MNLTVEELEKTAALAYLDPKDVATLLSETNSILNQIDRIHQLDITDIEPLIHPLQIFQFLREDVVSHTDCVDALAKAAPEFIDNYYLVPKHMKER